MAMAGVPECEEDCVILYRASNKSMHGESCDYQRMWHKDAFELAGLSSLEFDRAVFVWAAIVHVEAKGRGNVDRCASWTKNIKTALGRAFNDKQKYLHVVCFKKRRVVDLSSRSAWLDQVKTWLKFEDGVVDANGERDCTAAFKWSIFLEEVESDRVDMEQKAEWYISKEVCELDNDLLAAASADDDEVDAVKSIVRGMMKTV